MGRRCYPRYAKNWTAPATAPGFVYTTHPWIVNEYFTAAARCGSAHRNATAVSAVEEGIKAGKYAWHAKALTMIHELCDPDLFAWSLTMASLSRPWLPCP